MPRTPNPEEVCEELEHLLAELRSTDNRQTVHLTDGRTLKYDSSYLLGLDGSLGPVARLILMRRCLQSSAKELQKKYRSFCEVAGCSTSNYTSLQYAFSLTTTQLKRLPLTANLIVGMGAILNEWRAEHGNGGLGLPPHPETNQLFDKPFIGDDACQRFLNYLEYSSSPATQLASGRELNLASDRQFTLD
ncbi:MAG: hypothetical protein KTR32_13055, partial [Granulosicoccus sp.]|nr:hypothetical protein [Granulosicoccus sp.]